jgi:hypothetical protein
VGYKYKVRIYQNETEDAPDDPTTNADTDISGTPDAGPPPDGPTDDMPGDNDAFDPGDDERAGTPGSQMSGGQRGVDVDPDTGTITITSDHELSPEEKLAALESASQQITNEALNKLHDLEDAEAGGDAGDIAAAAAQFEEVRKAMTVVDNAVSDRKESLMRPR